jgi:hypothetical protein
MVGVGRVCPYQYKLEEIVFRVSETKRGCPTVRGSKSQCGIYRMILLVMFSLPAS